MRDFRRGARAWTGSAWTTTSSTSAATRCWRRGWSAADPRRRWTWSCRSARCSRPRPWPASGRAACDEAGAARPALVRHAAARARCPLSLAQQRLWFLTASTPRADLQHPVAIRLSGALDLAALQRGAGRRGRAARERCARCSPRTRRAPAAGPAIRRGRAASCRFRRSPRASSPQHSATRLAGLDWRFDVAGRACRCEARLFELERRRESRAGAGGAPHRRRRLVDGAAGARSGGRLCGAHARGGSRRWAPLPVQYADYALWQRERAGLARRSDSRWRGSSAYWREALAGCRRS